MIGEVREDRRAVLEVEAGRAEQLAEVARLPGSVVGGVVLELFHLRDRGEDQVDRPAELVAAGDDVVIAAGRVRPVGGRGDGADVAALVGELVGQGDEALDVVGDVAGVAVEHRGPEGADSPAVQVGRLLLVAPRRNAAASGEGKVLVLDSPAAALQFPLLRPAGLALFGSHTHRPREYASRQSATTEPGLTATLA